MPSGARRRALVAIACLVSIVVVPLSTARADDGSSAPCGTMPQGTTIWSSAGVVYDICSLGITVGPGATVEIDDRGGPIDVLGGPIDIEGGTVTTVPTTDTPTDAPNHFENDDLVVSTAPDSPTSTLVLANSIEDPIVMGIQAGGNARVSLTDVVIDADSTGYSAVTLSGDAHATLRSVALESGRQSGLSMAEGSTADLDMVSLESEYDDGSASVDVQDAATLHAECLSLTNDPAGIVTNSTATTVLDDSDLFAIEGAGHHTVRQVVGGAGKVDAAYDAWNRNPLLSFEPRSGQLAEPGQVTVTRSAANWIPRATARLAGPVSESDGAVRGAGIYHVSITMDHGADESLQPDVVLSKGRRHVQATGSWISHRLWRGTLSATPTTLPSGSMMVHVTGISSCADDVSMESVDLPVSVDDRVITPILTATDLSSSLARLSWSQPGRQSGTTFALRRRAGGSNVWRDVAGAATLTVLSRQARRPRHGRGCYEVRATAYRVTSRWSTERCVVA